jgi:SAM-dependent methyltransferase
MNPETVKRLRALNNDFYRNNAVSFSKTRQSPWPGWTRCLEALKTACASTGENTEADGRQDGQADDYPGDQSTFGQRILSRRKLTVFDLACGNLRFEDFLASALPETTLAFYAVDNCDSLVSRTPDAKDCRADHRAGSRTDYPADYRLNYQNLDVLKTLQSDLRLNDQLAAPLCDLAVSFGFLHHIPLEKYRKEVLASLVRQTRPGGLIVVSLWQFLNDEVLAKRAQITHERALAELGLPALDSNDYLLGWKNLPGTYRYCHSFSETEIDRLIQSVAPKTMREPSSPTTAFALAAASTSASAEASVVARFASDGKTANLNSYLILRVL